MSFLLYFFVNLFVSLFVLKISAEWAYGKEVGWAGALLQLVLIGILQFVLAAIFLGFNIIF
jgi:hypothetical protein